MIFDKLNDIVSIQTVFRLNEFSLSVPFKFKDERRKNV